LTCSALGRRRWALFQRWSGLDFVAIGCAALALSLIARHVLGVQLGLWDSLVGGMILVPIGLWRIFVKGDY
jgi:putative Mn2+ efflux pump MntP